MDLASLVGLVGAFGIVIFAMILGGDITMFVNVPSLLIVIVGSLFAVMMKFELGQFLAAAKVAGKAFAFKLIKPEDLIGEIVELAGLARKGGLLSLEGKEVSDEFLSKGIQLLVDGHDPDVAKISPPWRRYHDVTKRLPLQYRYMVTVMLLKGHHHNVTKMSLPRRRYMFATAMSLKGRYRDITIWSQRFR